MAIFQCNYRSKVQGRSVFFDVILPDQCEKDVPTVYMLHGGNSNHFDWTKSLSLERYATARSIAIVMPDGDNSCYVDMKYGFPHYTHIIEELIPYTRKMFGLSDKREKTFISGFSMGGYGCLSFALKNPDIFGACAPMSSGIGWDNVGNDNLMVPVFGLDWKNEVKKPEYDLYALAENCKGENKPWIYHCCGTEDFLIKDNREFRDFMQGKDFHYNYEEWSGAHTWDFWDQAIPKCLDFFKIYMKENGVEEYFNGRFPSSVEHIKY